MGCQELRPRDSLPSGLPQWHGACSAEESRDAGSILGLGRPLEKEMATCSSVLAWKIPWTEEPGRPGGHKDPPRLSTHTQFYAVDKIQPGACCEKGAFAFGSVRDQIICLFFVDRACVFSASCCVHSSGYKGGKPCPSMRPAGWCSRSRNIQSLPTCLSGLTRCGVRMM